MSVTLCLPEYLTLDWFAELRADYFAALEAERVTPSAEPDALTPVVMSGGAEPAGAAKHSPLSDDA